MASGRTIWKITGWNSTFRVLVTTFSLHIGFNLGLCLNEGFEGHTSRVEYRMTLG